MNKKTIEEEVKAFFEECWRDYCGPWGFRNRPIEMEWFGDRLNVVISNMYEYFDITYDNLKRFADAIGATECDIDKGDAMGGCESCDYGSRYPKILSFWGWK